MKNLSRLLLSLDERLIGITLVYLDNNFALFMDDKKSKNFSEREILSLLGTLNTTAVDLPTNQKKNPKDIISAVKGSKFDNSLELSVESTQLKDIKFS